MDLRLHIGVHARKKSFLRHTHIPSPYLSISARARSQPMDPKQHLETFAVVLKADGYAGFHHLYKAAGSSKPMLGSSRAGKPE
jgi:hypothetical protein